MSKPKSKRSTKRDVLEETIEFLMSRKAHAATVSTVAGAMGLSPAGASYRLKKLESLGRVTADAGYYRVTLPPERRLPSGEPTLADLWAELKAERERIDSQIKAVEEAMALLAARRQNT